MASRYLQSVLQVLIDELGNKSTKMRKMKIQELRDLIKSADRDKRENAFAEGYKQFTKRQKEEVDLLI